MRGHIYVYMKTHIHVQHTLATFLRATKDIHTCSTHVHVRGLGFLGQELVASILYVFLTSFFIVVYAPPFF